jgi:hypothetical protein
MKLCLIILQVLSTLTLKPTQSFTLKQYENQKQKKHVEFIYIQPKKNITFTAIPSLNATDNINLILTGINVSYRIKIKISNRFNLMLYEQTNGIGNTQNNTYYVGIVFKFSRHK